MVKQMSEGKKSVLGRNGSWNMLYGQTCSNLVSVGASNLKVSIISLAFMRYPKTKNIMYVN